MPDPLRTQLSTENRPELQHGPIVVGDLPHEGCAFCEVVAEGERLRRRTHEIAEAKDQEKAGLEHDLARHRNNVAAARERVAHWVANWTNDPPSKERDGWWRYSSSNDKDDLVAIVGEMRDAQAERDRYIRLFNRLEAAVSHHKKAHLPEGRCFADDPDEALWKARDKILRDSCEGKG